MTIYILLFLILLISSVLELKNTSVSKFLFIVNIVILYIIATLRYGIGADYFQYQELFEQALPINEISYQYLSNNIHNIEYGYLIFESLIKLITNDYFIFLGLYNFFMFLFLYRGIQFFKTNKNLQLLVFYSFIYLQYTMDTYRQGMAIAITLYSMKFLVERRLVYYFVTILIASFFHKASVLLMPLYFLVNLRYSYAVLITFIVFSTLVSYFDVTGKIISCLNDLSDFGFIRRVHYYYFVKHDQSLKISFLAYLQRFFILGIIFIFYKDNEITSNLVIFYVCLFMIFSNVGVLAGRISGMLLVSYMLYFSNLLYKLENKGNKLLLFFFVIIYSGLIFFKDLYIIHPLLGNYKYIPFNFYPFQ